MDDFWKKFLKLEDSEEQTEITRIANQALAARDRNGFIVPIIPEGPGPAADMVGQVYYPAPKPDQDGCIHPIIRDADFVGGQLPNYLEYAPGWERPDRPYDGQSLDGIVYCDPVRNLPPYQQVLLRRAPGLALPTDQPANNLDPSTIILPKPVKKTEYGMAIETKEGKEVLSNFNVSAVRRCAIKKHGEPDAEEFELEVSPIGADSQLLRVSASTLDNLVPIISKRFPVCHTNEDATKASLRIANNVRNQIPTLPTVIVVKSTGFIRLNDRWVYAHDGAVFNGPVEFRTGYTIPCDPGISRTEALRALLGILELAEGSPTMLPLLLMGHLGPLYNLFDAAGFAPKFVLFLHGQTGSLKTAVVQALYRLFKELPTTPEATFRDTKTALEVKIGAACSRVLPIDDYKPAVTSATGREDEDKLEHIVRMFGDGVAKARSNSELGRAKEFHPAGCCVVTGEDTGGSHSSLLRCLVLSVQKGEINGEKLRFFQENPVVLQTHFYHFLEWAGVHGDAIVDFIRREFQGERQFFSEIVQEPRQADIGATMMLTARILLGYVQEVMALNGSEVFDVEQRWANTLMEVLRRSEEDTVELDPVRMYLEALFDGQAAGRINIAPTQTDFRRGYHLGFAKDGVWWLFPREIYSHVKQHWKAQGVIFPLKAEKVHALLYQKQLLEVSRENRKGREKILYTKKSTLETRPRMLVLRAEEAQSYIENSEKQGGCI